MNQVHRQGTFSRLPRILQAIIYTNGAIFALSLLFSGSRIHLSMNPLDALAPATDVLRFLGASGTGAVKMARWDIWWTFINANWLHGSLLHLVFNMIALSQIAPLVILGYGRYRMITIYTLSGICGFFLSYKAGIFLTVGASAGICGLIGAALFFGKTEKGPTGALIYRQTMGWVVSLVLIGFFIPNINNWGHGGGMAGGLILGWLLKTDRNRKENVVDKGMGIALLCITAFFLGQPLLSAFAAVF